MKFRSLDVRNASAAELRAGQGGRVSAEAPGDPRLQ